MCTGWAVLTVAWWFAVLIMNVFEVIVGFAFLSNAILGVAVLKTNPLRLVNRHYFLLTNTVGLWLLSVWFVLRSDSAEGAELGIRCASVFSLGIFNIAHMLVRTIRDDLSSMWAAIKSVRWLFVPLFLMGAVCCSDFFMSGVSLPDHAHPLTVAEPIYGGGFFLLNLYFAGNLLCLVVGLMNAIRGSNGMQRLELQYVAAGALVGMLVGGLFAFVIPALNHSSQTAPLAPLCVILFDGIIAYGIARRRIMDVSGVLQRSVAVACLTVFMGIVYFLSWMVLNWTLTVSCGLPAVIPSFVSSVVAMASLYVVRPYIRGWVDHFFFDRKGGNVAEALDRVSRQLQNITTMDRLLEQFMALGPPLVGAETSTMLIAQKGRYSWAVGDQATADLVAKDPVEVLLEKERIPLLLENVERQQQTGARAAFCRRMRELKCYAAVGVFSPRKLEGILLLGPRTGGLIYSYVELDALQLLCNQLAVSLENASLYTEVQNAKIYNEILLDQLVTGVVAADAGGRVTFFNREAQRITGLPDLKGQPISLLPEKLQQYWKTAVENGEEVRDMDLKIMLADAVQIPVRLSASPFRSAQGGVLGALLVFNDMRDMKALEAKIRRADRLMSVGTLAAGMAHEIKNPLVSIKTFSQLLPERYDDPDFRTTFSELMGQEVGRIDGIVNQLLSFARPQKPTLEPMRMHDVLGKSVPLVQEQLKARGLTLALKLHASNDLIQGDASLLHQVFVNFFLNAIDAMDHGGRLTIRTHNAEPAALGDPRERESSWIRIEVADTGKGISRDEMLKIFDPFYTSKSEGTGLGLSVAYNIIEEHGGTIDVSSQLGEGTHFSILLPVSEEGIVS